MMSESSYRLVPWTLSVLILSALPHAINQPTHISILIIGLLLGRFFLHKKVLRMPANWIKFLMVGVCLATILMTYGTITGAIAGGALLLCMAAIKSFEMNSLRDHTALILAAFFIIVSFVLDNSEIWVGLYVLLATSLGILCLLKVSAPAISTQLLLKKAKLFFLYGAPISIILFVLFPRIPGPLWGVQNFSNKASTGISDTMSPGSISELVKDDSLAFRAKFSNKEPARSQLYWRGPVLHDFDGKTWSRPDLPVARSSENNTSLNQENAITYDVILEPHNNKWLFTLDYPNKLPEKSLLQRDYLVYKSQKVTKLTRYSASANLTSPTDNYASNYLLNKSLTLPRNARRTKELARSWKAQNKTDEEIVQSALTLFNKQLFSYTLSPEQPDRNNSVDDFMFRTREGFCGHYASAFVVMMRAADIPARVVTGYLGGEKNPLNGYYRIKQSDAHAWTEIYLKDKGWTRVDPTGAIAPERIEQSLAEAFPDETWGGFFGGTSFMLRLENSWYALNTAWFEWVLEFDAEKQMGLMEKLGFKNPDWRALIYLLVAGILSGTLFMSFLFWRQSKNIYSDPMQKIYQQFLLKLQKHDFTTSHVEGPKDLLERLTNEEHLNKNSIKAFLKTYINARYYNHVENPQALKTLKSLIKEI